MKIKYDANLLGIMNIFQQTTHANLRDCFADNNSVLTFIVEPNEIGKAIGKNAIHIRILEKILKRKIKIIEYCPELEKFITNVIYPLKVSKITLEDNIITLEPIDSKTRGYLIGRAAANLRNYETIIKRYFPNVSEVKVK